MPERVKGSVFYIQTPHRDFPFLFSTLFDLIHDFNHLWGKNRPLLQGTSLDDITIAMTFCINDDVWTAIPSLHCGAIFSKDSETRLAAFEKQSGQPSLYWGKQLSRAVVRQNLHRQ